MKRLFSNLEPATPFVNDDFNNILQDQHRIAYSGYLEGMNDVKYMSPDEVTAAINDLPNNPESWNIKMVNRGIILEGITFDASPTIQKYHFDWNITISRTALVYFDGQYHTPEPGLIGSSLTNTIPFINIEKIFIYPISITQSNPVQVPADPEGSITRIFRSSDRLSVISDYQFAIATNENYPGSTTGVPCIILEHGGTSRNLSRLIRYNTSVPYDLKISYDVVKWQLPQQHNWGLEYMVTGFDEPIPNQDAKPTDYTFRDFEVSDNNYYSSSAQFYGLFMIGRNEMQGFVIPQWEYRSNDPKWNSWNSTVPKIDPLMFIHLSPTNSRVNEAQGKFLVGFDPTKSQTPKHLTACTLTQVFNYGTPSNTGGWITVTISSSQLQAHNHGGLTEKPRSFIRPTDIFNAASSGLENNPVLPPPDYPVSFGKPTLQTLDHCHMFYANIARVNTAGAAAAIAIGYGQAPPADNDPNLQDYLNGDNIFLTRSRPFFLQQLEDATVYQRPEYPVPAGNVEIPETASRNQPQNHRHEIAGVVSGDGDPHPNIPPYKVVLYYFKHPIDSDRLRPGFHKIRL